MKQIGIKFCGGCNPRIDRGQLARQIKESLSGLGYQVVYNPTDVDLMIYLSGCTANCAARGQAGLSGIVVAGESLNALTLAEEQLLGEILRSVRA